MRHKIPEPVQKTPFLLGLRNLSINQFSTTFLFFKKGHPGIILVFSPPFLSPNCLGPRTIQQELKKRLEVYERKLSAWETHPAVKPVTLGVKSWILCWFKKDGVESTPTPGTTNWKFGEVILWFVTFKKVLIHPECPTHIPEHVFFS